MERSVEHIAGIYIFVMVEIFVGLGGEGNFVAMFTSLSKAMSLLPFCHKYRLEGCFLCCYLRGRFPGQVSITACFPLIVTIDITPVPVQKNILYSFFIQR